MILTVFETSVLQWAKCKESFTIPQMMEECAISRTQATNIVEHLMDYGRVTNIGDIIDGAKVTTEFKAIR